MRRTFAFYTVFLMIAVASLIGCNKKPAKTGGDAIDQKLQQLAGGSATDCGRLKSQDPGQMKTASDCAMGAAQKKQPFYVAYDLPGMTVAVASASDGKLYMIQAQTGENGQPAAAVQVNAEPCPSELRVAQSGRITCTAPGSMGGMGGMGMGGNPHGGVAMPPAGGENPHGGEMMPPAGTPNPHAGGEAPKQ
jgi:hypothetical protein